MITKKMIGRVFCFLIVVAALAFSGCAKPPQPPSEAPVPASAIPPPPPSAPLPESAPAIPPPLLAEARAAIERVYKGVVSLDASRNPNFFAGDFNGDGSQDLAVIVKPAKDKLADINSDVAGWLIRDAQAETAPAPMMARNPSEMKTRPAITEHDDTLLVIIHGSGSAGWRDPAAQQSYLVKNAVGSNPSAQTKKSLRASNKYKSLPPLRGDVLNETMAGTSGFIYYTGASYAWHDPRSNQAEVAKRSAH